MLKPCCPQSGGGQDLHECTQLDHAVRLLGLKYMLSYWLRVQEVPPLHLVPITGLKKVT